jgi:hypothetical protein
MFASVKAPVTLIDPSCAVCAVQALLQQAGATNGLGVEGLVGGLGHADFVSMVAAADQSMLTAMANLNGGVPHSDGYGAHNGGMPSGMGM